MKNRVTAALYGSETNSTKYEENAGSNPDADRQLELFVLPSLQFLAETVQ